MQKRFQCRMTDKMIAEEDKYVRRQIRNKRRNLIM